MPDAIRDMKAVVIVRTLLCQERPLKMQRRGGGGAGGGGWGGVGGGGGGGGGADWTGSNRRALALQRRCARRLDQTRAGKSCCRRAGNPRRSHCLAAGRVLLGYGRHLANESSNARRKASAVVRACEKVLPSLRLKSFVRELS